MTNQTFLSYLKDNIPNHLKAIGIVSGAALAVLSFNYWRDAEATKANQAKIIGTLSQQLQTYASGSAVSGNQQQTQKDVNQQSSNAFGSDVISYMRAQNASIQSLTSIIAQQKAQTNSIQVQPNTFTPAQVTPTGALTGYQMEEHRNGAPPLASLNLFYDPSKKDPNEALKGSTWTHYAERFTASVGEWAKQSDGSFKTSVSAITRTVIKPDPRDPTKTITVGVEDIPITEATTIYTPKGLLAGAVPVVPRWTASFGVSKDSTSGLQPSATIDYRLTDKFGLFVGAANKAPIAGVSIRLGK